MTLLPGPILPALTFVLRDLSLWFIVRLSRFYDAWIFPMRYKSFFRDFRMLKSQYPADTRFVVLPMDIAYMEAGKLKKEHNYHEQMEELAGIKADDDHWDQFFPFIFADPGV